MARFSDYPVRSGSMALIAALSGAGVGIGLVNLLHIMRHDPAMIVLVWVGYAATSIAICFVLTWAFFPDNPNLKSYSLKTGIKKQLAGLKTKSKPVEKREVDSLDWQLLAFRRKEADMLERHHREEIAAHFEPPSEDEFAEKLKHIPFGAEPDMPEDLPLNAQDLEVLDFALGSIDHQSFAENASISKDDAQKRLELAHQKIRRMMADEKV